MMEAIEQRNERGRGKAVYYLLGALILIIVPLFLSSYGQGLFTRFLIFALFAMSYNVVFGYTGMLSLGHAAFFGAGGYAVAILKLHYDINFFWIGAPLGILLATGTAALFGFVAMRAVGIYFLLVTFALGQMLYALAWNVKWLSSPGMNGITGIPLPNLGIPGFSLNTTSFYYMVLIFFAVSFFLLRRLLRSPFGLALQGIREDESRMQAVGYNVWLYKYTIFVITGAFAGIAGVLFTYYNFFVSPKHLGVVTSFLPMVMSIMGGLGTFVGPIIGAAVFVYVENFSSIYFPELWPLVLGGLFVLTILFAGEGIGVYLWALWTKVSRHYGSSKS
jgi:branched-chain amino acid transport system permease protein